MNEAGIRLAQDGPVASVTLCRPEVLNAQTPAMWARLRSYGRELPGDVRVVVVRGEGRAFSSGLDLEAVSLGGEATAPGPGALRPRRKQPVGHATVGDTTSSGGVVPTRDTSPPGGTDPADGGLTFAGMAARDTAQALELLAEFQEAFSWLRRPDIISIAAVQGHAIGAGFQLALAADLRILADDAKLTMAEVSLGLVPDLGGTKRLVELVGYSRALEICVTGRRLGAAEAERMGLANAVVPRAELDRAVEELTAQILAAPRDAVIEVKALLRDAGDRRYAEQEAAEREAQVRRIRDLVGAGE